MRSTVLVLAAALVVHLPLPAIAQEPAWAAGDTWRWTVAGAYDGTREARVADGAPLRTLEVERVTPAGTADVTELRVTRTWAAPLRLSVEEKVTPRCVETPLTGKRCGNLTERWTFTPALDLMRGTAGWSQALHVEFARIDELGVLNGTGAWDETRTVQFVGLFNYTANAATYATWKYMASTDARDKAGPLGLMEYAPAIAQLVVWQVQPAGDTGSSSTNSDYLLSAATLVGGGATGGGTGTGGSDGGGGSGAGSGGGSGTGAGSGSGSGGGTSTGGNATGGGAHATGSGGNTTAGAGSGGTASSAGAGGAASGGTPSGGTAGPAAGGDGPVGPSAEERKLRASGPGAALVLLAVALLALRRRG